MTKPKLALKFKKMKNLSLIIICLFNFYLATAQPQDLEKVDLEMLHKTQSSIDPNASAEILYERGEISFVIIKGEIKYLYKVTKRIKIYDEDGYDQANIQIPYYIGKGNLKEYVKSIKAKTYYEENNKVKSEKVRIKEVFEIELNENLKAKKFTFPKIQNGVVIEYSYLSESPYIMNLPSWSFQSRIPTVYSEYETFIPVEFVTYRKHNQGFYPVQTKEEFTENVLGGTTQKTNVSRTKHYANSLSAIDPENYVNNASNYSTSVTYEISTHNFTESGLTKHLSSTWESVVENLKKNANYPKEISNTDYFSDDLDLVLQNKTTDLEKTEAIFNFLKEKVEWNNINSAHVNNKLKNVYEEGAGNSAEINMMLTAMLNYAEIEANPLVLCTISAGLPLFPSVSKFNYIIARAKVDEKFMLLDASNKHSTPNVPPAKVLNGQGFELTSYGFKNVPLIPFTESKVNYNLFAKINETGDVAGQCRVFYFDQFALSARNAFENQREENILKSMSKHFKIDDISDFSQLNIEDLNKPLVQSFKFQNATGFVEQVGEKIYLSPLLFLGMDNNPFKDKERKYPVDFTFPKSYTYRLQIDLPEGYAIDYIPEKTVYKMENDMLIFSYLIQEYNGKLVVDVSKNISVATVLPKDYGHLVKYYNSMFEKENEKVVLVKQ